MVASLPSRRASLMLRMTLPVLLLIASPGWAQDITSGPGKGEKIPELKVFDATGPHKDKDVDYAAERKDKPTIYYLIRDDKFDRPMNRFLKTLDQQLAKDFKDVYAVAVMVTEDLDKTKERLPKVQQSVMYDATALTCTKESPKGWNVNSDA